MRFYSLSIANSSGNQILQYTNYPGGSYDPGGLNVIFDLYVYTQATPMGNSWIKVEGVPQSILSNAQQFAGTPSGPVTLTLSGGMGAGGLPLANPAQAGLLVAGNVFQSFGTWVGTQVDITFFVQGSIYSINNPGNIVLNWTAGTQLSTALQNTLQTAYPGYKINMNISNNLVLNHDEKGAYSTLSGLAQLLEDITPTSVQITINNNVINVFDSTYQPTPKPLVFTDFIGQAQWIDQNVIQIRTVLRSDIQVGSQIKMPQGYANIPGFVQTTYNSYPSSINYTSAIKGNFWVQQVRHVGDLRAPNGNSWCTIINAVPVPAQASS